MDELRADRVPPEVVVLLPLAEEWGLPDDRAREAKVDSSDVETLRSMLEVVDSVEDSALYGWLAGPESFDPNPTPEYVAITCLTMAADSARIRLEQEDA